MKQLTSALLAVVFAGTLAPGSVSELRASRDDSVDSGNRERVFPSSPQQKQKGPIRVQTDLVNVLANVLDAKNEPVVGLDQSAFEITEEGVAQKIVRFEPQTDRPLDLVLMIDMSGSAAIELKIEKDAAEHFFEEVVRKGDRFSVFSFTSDVTQLSNFTDNVKVLEDAVRHAEPGSDMGTSLYDALLLGSQTLKRMGSGRRRAIVVITDAGETTSISKFDDAKRAAIASDALLYTVVVRPMKSNAGWNTAGEHAVETITDSTGGAMYYPTTMDEIQKIFDLINRELRTQYLLGYYPTPPPPAGTLRHITVKVNTGDTVRFRKQYMATSNP